MEEEVFNVPSLFEMKKLNKKGQTGGLVTGLVMGVITLVIVVILAFVIISTLSPINDTIASSTPAVQIVNESVTNLVVAGDLLSVNALNGVVCTGVAMVNASDNVVILAPGNYTIQSGCNLTGTALSPFLTYDVKETYTYTYKITSESADLLTGNFTKGIDNISGKIPTVLLIAAIVLILGILAVLVGVWQKMRMGGGGSI